MTKIVKKNKKKIKIVKKEITVVPAFESYSSTTIKKQALECILEATILALQEKTDVCINFAANGINVFDDIMLTTNYIICYKSILENLNIYNGVNIPI